MANWVLLCVYWLYYTKVTIYIVKTARFCMMRSYYVVRIVLYTFCDAPSRWRALRPLYSVSQTMFVLDPSTLCRVIIRKIHRLCCHIHRVFKDNGRSLNTVTDYISFCEVLYRKAHSEGMFRSLEELSLSVTYEFIQGNSHVKTQSLNNM